MISDLVARKSVPIVVFDAGEGLAAQAAARLGTLGYTAVELLEGGCDAWRAAGGELFSGINVPSKAFGEFVEHQYETPRIAADELDQLRASGQKLVILDSRPFEEYQRMCIPGGIDAPGAELAYRVHDIAPQPDTLVVVNCAGHLAGSRHALGGQLVQATDEYVGVRHARLVLIDPQRVRAIMTASWLNQMGWHDVYVLASFAGFATETGPRKAVGFKPWAITTAPGGTVLDFSTSLRFHHRHIPGAWWAVRSRLKEAREKIGDDARVLLLTSEDGVLAHLAAPEVAALWPKAQVRVLDGGNAAWKGSWESGHERSTTARDDVWYKPYDHEAGFEQHAREYLAWEVALIQQIKRDPTIRFQKF